MMVPYRPEVGGRMNVWKKDAPAGGAPPGGAGPAYVLAPFRIYYLRSYEIQ